MYKINWRGDDIMKLAIRTASANAQRDPFQPFAESFYFGSRENRTEGSLCIKSDSEFGFDEDWKRGKVNCSQERRPSISEFYRNAPFKVEIIISIH